MLAQTTKQPDILEVISDLSNDEVFTPPKVANDVLDILPVDVWSNPQLRWLDPGCKTGVFLREVTKRLMIGLADVLPDEQQRLDHILQNMVFGISITELTSLMARRTLYCSKDAAGERAVVSMDRAEGNVWFDRVEHSYDKNGRCTECSASREQMERDNRENYAYGFIHATGRAAIQEEFDMKFDVIVGNPPYQMEDEGHGRSASPIYHQFVQAAIDLNPRFISLVIPSRWFGGGKGLDGFRKDMLSSEQLRNLVDFQDATDVFPSVDLAGGICYFLWDRDYIGPCEVESASGMSHGTSTRKLNEFDVFVRDNVGVQVVRKVVENEKLFLDSSVSARKPFGLDTQARPIAEGDINLRWQNGVGPYQRSKIATGMDKVDKWKVIVSYAGFEHAGSPDKDGRRRVLSVIDILPPGTICNETYLVAGSFASENEAMSLRSYMRTRFFRFLLAQRMFSQHLTRSTYAFVPQQSWDREWTDAELFEKYGITEDEQAYIAEMIREMPA